MRWNIEGADAKTGADRVVSIDADSQQEAEHQARRKGLLVSAVYRSVVKDKVEAMDEMIEAVQAQKAPRSPVVDYRSPEINNVPAPSPRSPVPHYSGLRFAAAVLLAFAIIYYSFAAVAVILAILAALGDAGGSRVDFLAEMTSALLLAWSLGLGVFGTMLHAASAACEALRDIARNSFRR